MGRNLDTEVTCPRGIKVREFEHKKRIQIAFTFKGVECRELLSPRPITTREIDYAVGLRAEILRKIKDDVFHYPDFFPDSPRADRFVVGASRVLIGTLLDKQQQIYERQVQLKRLSPSTVEGYVKAMNSERMKHWRDRPLVSVTPSELRKWLGDIDSTAKFVRNLITPLRAVFEDALNDDLIDFNPFDRIAMTKLLKKSTRPSDYEVDPFTAEERSALLKAARSDERPTIQFWFNAGLRPGELIAFKWAKVDWVHQKARVDVNQVVGVEKEPKTKAGIRDVELNSTAMDALSAQKAFSFLAGNHVFLNPRTGAPWANDAQLRKTLWEPLCKRAGVRYRNPYQTRHTYASTLLTSGENPWYVAQQLGHADVQMVFRTYGKFIPEDYQKPRAALKLVS